MDTHIYMATDDTGYSEQIEAETVDDAIETIKREWPKFINAPVKAEIIKMNLAGGNENVEAFDDERTEIEIFPITQST